MLLRIWSTLKGYVFALAANGVALALTFWLAPLLEPNPYPFFVVAIAAAAWFFGFGPALFSAVLAFLSVNYYFIPPLADITLSKQDASNLLLFMLVTAIAVSMMRTRKQAAEAQAQLGAIVTGAQEAILEVGLDGAILSWNASAERVYGYPAREARGQSIHLLSLSGDNSELDEKLAQASQGEPTSQWEIRQRTRTGKEIEVSLSIAPICDRGTQITHLSLIASDITERKRAEGQNREKAAQIEVQRRLLEQREQERQQIARDLHDGPVQAITGVTLALRSIILDLQAAEFIPRLEAIQATLQEQIHDLRTYAGELRPPALSRFGLERAIRSHLEEFQMKHPEIRLQLDSQLEDDPIPAEKSLALFRIYQECLVNIIKHAQATRIAIHLSKSSNMAILGISDNGAGFVVSEDWLELARQGHLGLVGMRERAEAVGGTLEIHSHPGQGTSIQVSIPLQETVNYSDAIK